MEVLLLQSRWLPEMRRLPAASYYGEFSALGNRQYLIDSRVQRACQLQDSQSTCYQQQGSIRSGGVDQSVVNRAEKVHEAYRVLIIYISERIGVDYALSCNFTYHRMPYCPEGTI